MENHELVLKAQQGDVDAYGELYERHAPGIFRFLYAHLEHRQDAEDLTEEVFLRVWQALPRYHERGVPFQFYLLRIARNALIDHYRRRQHSDRQSDKSMDEMENQLAAPLDRPVGAAEHHQELVRCLSQLPEDHRTVLVLRYLNQLTPEETGLVMGRSAGAIRTLQHRALTALRARMELEMNRGMDEAPDPST